VKVVVGLGVEVEIGLGVEAATEKRRTSGANSGLSYIIG
jgi:uncharacterized Fe-S cluster-containing MiaB family protein